MVSRGYSLVAACRLLIAVSSLVELRLWVWASFRSCGGAHPEGSIEVHWAAANEAEAVGQ